MPRIRVVTDSAADIPAALLQQLDITVAPMGVRWGDDDFIDGVTITGEEALRRWRLDGAGSGEVLAPSVEEMAKTYRSMRETCDGVISIHLSSRLKDTFTNAQVARGGFGMIGQGGPFPIAVTDSMSLSMGLGWLALAVARAAKLGLDLNRLATMSTRMAGATHFAFFTEQLAGLARNARGTRLAGQIESLSGTHPLLHLDEGQVTVYERTRTRVKARDALYNFVEDFPKIGELAVLHTGAHLDLEHLMTRIGAIYPRERVMILEPGAAVSTMLGPDALGVAVIEAEE